MSSESAVTTAQAPPVIVRRLLTDLRVSQIPWWSQRLTYLPIPSARWRGAILSLINGVLTITHGLRHDAFISANYRNAMALGLFKRLTGRRRPAVVMTELRLDDPRPGLAWRLKAAAQGFACRGADALCVSARQEIDNYSMRLRLPRDRFHFVPWHTNVLEPRWCPPNGTYVFAAGRTSRDWVTLANAVRDLDVQVTVVCTARDAATVAFPPNVTVLTDIPHSRYRELLEGATVVVVPLEPHFYSSGQVVILEAMGLGKPVITTRVLGSEDYVVEGVDGMLVEPRSVSDLRAAISRILGTRDLAERLGRAALEKVTRMHHLEHYVRRIVEVADRAAERAARG